MLTAIHQVLQKFKMLAHFETPVWTLIPIRGTTKNIICSNLVYMYVEKKLPCVSMQLQITSTILNS